MSSSGAGRFLSLGQTKVDVTGRYGGDLPAAIAASGHGKEFILASPTTLLAKALLGDHDTLTGSPSAPLTATGAATKFPDDAMIANADQVNGNTHITIRCPLDGNNANNGGKNYKGVHLVRCDHTDVLTGDIDNMPARGIEMDGYGGSPKPRGNRIVSRITNCGDRNLMLSNGMRDTEMDVLIRDGRGTFGAWIDASECRGRITVDSHAAVGAKLNNIFGASLKIVTTRCQQDGAQVSELVGSDVEIRSQNNGQASGGVAGAGWAEMRLIGDASQTYGINNESVIRAVLGAVTQVGAEDMYGITAADYALYVEDGNAAATNLTVLLNQIGPTLGAVPIRWATVPTPGIRFEFPRQAVMLNADTAGMVSGVLADVAGMALRLAPYARLRFLLDGFADGDSTADLKYGWSVPAGASMNWFSDDYVATVAASALSAAVGRAALTEAQSRTTGLVGTGGASSPLGVRAAGIVTNGATAGVLQLRAAQGAVQAGLPTILKAGTLLEGWRVG
jgi:hypothetical protein